MTALPAAAAWLLRGPIIKGHQRGGSQLGFPTANIQLDENAISHLKSFLNTVWAGFAVIEPSASISSSKSEENASSSSSSSLPFYVAGADLMELKGYGRSWLATYYPSSKQWTFRENPGTAALEALSQQNQKQKLEQEQPEEKEEETRNVLIYPTVLSVGTNPHFKDQSLTVEPYIMHKFSQDFYGRCLRIVAVEKLRDMGAFTTLENLIKQIEQDCLDGTKIIEKKDSLVFRNLLLDDDMFSSSSSSSNQQKESVTSSTSSQPTGTFFKVVRNSNV